MLKRTIAAIQKRLLPERNLRDQLPEQSNEAFAARRGFFKKAAIGTASITGTAGLAKAVVDSVPQPEIRDKYIKDSLAGEAELVKREYVLMSDQEKTDMIQGFVDNYSDQL